MKRIALTTIILFISVGSLRAQFLHFKVTVEPETSVRPIENLTIRNLKSYKNTAFINLRSDNKGIIEIKGYGKQIIMVQYDAAVVLRNMKPVAGDSLIFYAKAAYANNGINDVSRSIHFNPRAFFKIFDPPSEQTDHFNSRQFRRSAYVYIFGEVETKGVKNGAYRGELNLKISYY